MGGNLIGFPCCISWWFCVGRNLNGAPRHDAIAMTFPGHLLMKQILWIHSIKATFLAEGRFDLPYNLCRYFFKSAFYIIIDYIEHAYKLQTNRMHFRFKK